MGDDKILNLMNMLKQFQKKLESASREGKRNLLATQARTSNVPEQKIPQYIEQNIENLDKIEGVADVSGGVRKLATKSIPKVSGVFSKYDLPENIKIGKQHLPASDVGEEVGFNYRLDQNPDNIYYNVKDNKVVGHLGLDDNRSIKAVYVDPKYRRKGVAKELYKTVAEKEGGLYSDDFYAMEPEAKALWESLAKERPEEIIKTPSNYEWKLRNLLKGNK